MPKKLRGPCTHPGCPRLAVAHGKCELHQTDRRVADRDYARRRLDTEEQAFYKSARWQKLRAWKLARDPMCEQCAAEGRTTPATLVDHIVPLKDGGDPMLVDNLQSLCASCHARKHRSTQ